MARPELQLKLKSIETKLYIAYILLIIVLAIDAIGLITWVTAPFFAASLAVFLRVRKMLKAARLGDIETLKTYNSLGWAIVALIFSDIAPGVVLLLVYRDIKKLSTQ
jgi:uncharacterized membrane protein